MPHYVGNIVVPHKDAPNYRVLERYNVTQDIDAALRELHKQREWLDQRCVALEKQLALAEFERNRVGESLVLLEQAFDALELTLGSWENDA